MTLTQALSWVACGASLLSLWCYGNRSRFGPVVGLMSQVPWIALGVLTGLWGMVASSFVFGAIHVRNFFKKH